MQSTNNSRLARPMTSGGARLGDSSSAKYSQTYKGGGATPLS